MTYRSMQPCVDDLERTGHLIRIDAEIDPYLEAAEIQRRVFQSGGPAIYFANVKDCQFPMVSNLFGTMDRVRYIFRDQIDQVRQLIAMKSDPARFGQAPLSSLRAAFSARFMMPKQCRRGPVTELTTQLDRLPQLTCWPMDGGAFITLPLVYTERPDAPGLRKSNLGMYRIQISGNDYVKNCEVGLHYQIHRGIGLHHARAVADKRALRVNVFVGGTPAMSVAAVMPLPEGMSELGFAGALAGHRIRMISQGRDSSGRAKPAIYADADFCLSGTIDSEQLKPEGPFGDHLGYYSLRHDFPVLNVDRVYHRKGAVWPFTVVGRPPQEDSMFGQLIHELTEPVIPTVIPGVRAVHAVDAAGVHPLLLAIGSERYTPYQDLSQPMELLTQANAILGQGQMSLAKYLLIVADQDNPELDIDDVPAVFSHLLRRIDWRRDIHFQTESTIDTLDYSGTSINQGSKVVLAAAGPAVRDLATEIPGNFQLPSGYSMPRIVLAGLIAVQAPRWTSDPNDLGSLKMFCRNLTRTDSLDRFPLILLVDDSDFVARDVQNFLWVTFTRSNPAADIDGINSFIQEKHWGCRGPLVIDARVKQHHAPCLATDPKVVERVDAMAARGGQLAKYL